MYDLEQHSAPERARINARREELARLVELASMRPQVTLTVGPPGSPWFFRFDDQLVSAPVTDLLEESDDYCRGLALHEAAHATVTRLFDILNPKIAQNKAYHTLFNIIEDCRIETWMMERSPGARPWIHEYNSKLFTPILSQSHQASLSVQFLNALLAEWWFMDAPLSLDERVVKALDDTRDAVERAINAQPPRSIVTSEAYCVLYRQNRTLCTAYLKSDLLAPPSAFECLIRIKQLQMIHEVVRHVMPVYDALLELDRQEGRGESTESAMGFMLQVLRGHHLSGSTGAESAQPIPAELLRGLAELGLNIDGSCSQGQRSSQSQQGQQGHQGQQGQQGQQRQQSQNRSALSQLDQRALQEMIQRALDFDHRDAYLKVWRSLYREIDTLSESLLEVLTARSKPKWVRGLSSGTRIDLREAMAFEADPRRYNHLWMSQKRPEKIDPAIIIHLDISGSMSGSRITEAFKGLVLLAEVCSRLNLPLEVISFNNKARLIRAWDEKIGEEQRDRLARLLRQVDGSTYYAEALKLTAERLELMPFRDRFLIAISDGEPHDEDEVRRMIAELTRRGVSCLGLGIGPDTSELRRFFREGLYEVTPSEVAVELAQLLDRLLR